MTSAVAIAVTILILLAITALLVRDTWKLLKIKININRRTLVSILFSSSALTYVIFLAVSISFIDAHTPMDERILLPFLICLVVLIANELSNIKIDRQRQQLAIVLCLSLLAFSAYENTTRSGSLVSTSRNSGLGYAHRSIVDSPAMVVAGMLPSDHQIYSNGFDVIRYHAQRNVTKLPEEFRPATRNPSSEFETEMADMCAKYHSGNASIIYISNLQGRWYLPNAERIAKECGSNDWLSLGDSLILSSKVSFTETSNLPD